MKTEHINSPINDEEYIKYTPARQASSKKLSKCYNKEDIIDFFSSKVFFGERKSTEDFVAIVHLIF